MHVFLERDLQAASRLRKDGNYFKVNYLIAMLLCTAFSVRPCIAEAPVPHNALNQPLATYMPCTYYVPHRTLAPKPAIFHQRRA